MTDQLSPRRDQVGILSADLQEPVFLEVSMLERLHQRAEISSRVALSNLGGDVRWLVGGEAEVLQRELLAMLGQCDLRQETEVMGEALRIVTHGVKTGTGIALIPPEGAR
jgi:hypothetical protein